MGIASLTLMMRYEDNESALYLSSKWNERMFKSGCTPDTIDPAIILHYRNFEHSAIIAIATGSLCGHLFEGQFIVNSGSLNSCQRTWYQTSALIVLLRSILTLLITAPFMAGHFYFFPDIVSQMREDGTPIATRVLTCVVLVQTLPYFLTGFVAFGFLRYLFSKLHLDNPNALGKEFSTDIDAYAEQEEEI